MAKKRASGKNADQAVNLDIEGDLSPEHTDALRRDLHKDLKSDDVLANMLFNDSDGHHSYEDVRWMYDPSPCQLPTFHRAVDRCSLD
ncbi:MAG: hypothetical protein HQ518_31170 [Rhodopirellula sp.]|nr:hypothetical protein [Rhodopirellula sp.]